MTEKSTHRSQRSNFISALKSDHKEEIQRHHKPLFFTNLHKTAFTVERTQCFLVDRFWLIATKQPLHHMNSTLSKSRVRNTFNRCGHMVSVSRRFGVQAKRRANVDHKSAARWPMGTLFETMADSPAHFHLPHGYREVLLPCEERTGWTWEEE